MAASCRRRPQAHLPLSDSSFDLCTDVNLDSYNDAGRNFVAAYIGDLQIGRSRECKFPLGPSGASAVQLPQQPGQVPQPLGPGGVLERLVLGQHVNKALAQVVAVPAQGLPTAVTEDCDHLADLAFRAKPLSHRAPEEAQPS